MRSLTERFLRNGIGTFTPYRKSRSSHLQQQLHAITHKAQKPRDRCNHARRARAAPAAINHAPQLLPFSCSTPLNARGVDRCARCPHARETMRAPRSRRRSRYLPTQPQLPPHAAPALPPHVPPVPLAPPMVGEVEQPPRERRATPVRVAKPRRRTERVPKHRPYDGVALPRPVTCRYRPSDAVM